MRKEVNILVDVVQKTKTKHVLVASYAEYFAPFWAAKLRRLRDTGVTIGTVVHDPVRDFRIGPNWWHQYCISSAYSFVDVAFVHDATAQIDRGKPQATFPVVEVPHGPYDVPVADNRVSPAFLRDQHGIPQDAFVILSFGHIRDGKNLDLLIRALRSFPDVHLLVVGREQSSSQKPISWYQQLAQEQGVEERCHWVNRFVEDSEVEQFFRISDLAALLYSSDFYSASGVLNNVAQFELPVLCSSGGGPLRGLVEKYQLGKWVPPDDLNTVQSGLRAILKILPTAKWQQYRSDNSWQKNALLVVSNLFQLEDA